MPRKVVAWCFRTGHMAWQANDGIFVTFRNICTGTRLKWTILVCVFLPELLTNQRVNSAVVVNPGRNLCYLSLCVCVCACASVCVCDWGGGVCYEYAKWWREEEQEEWMELDAISVWSGKVQLSAPEAETPLLSTQASQSEGRKTHWLTAVLSSMTNRQWGSWVWTLSSCKL